MFTKNWYKFIGYCTAHNEDETYVAMDGTTKRSFSGSDLSPGFGVNENSYKLPSLYFLRNYFSGGVIIGTGNVPPTYNDCTLSGDMITAFTSTTNKVTHSLDDSGPSVTAEYTITNNGTKAFTIGEIALASHVGNSASTGITHACLFERSVLEVPITLEPGGVAKLTYTLRFNYPTA